MTGIEIALIVIGLIFVIGSFFIKEKLSKKDLDSIAGLTERELKIIVEKQLRHADEKVDDFVDEAIENSKDKTKRDLERTTNEKIMAINEYSDTVLDAINKSHNEVMFLYSMLNDKHTELTGLCSQLQRYSENMQNDISTMTQKTDPVAVNEEVAVDVDYVDTLTTSEEIKELDYEHGFENNHNIRILDLHKQGMSDVAIAKELDLGLGEVRLVIGLFKGESAHEI